MNPPTSSPLLRLHQLSLYNTGRMSPEQVILAFAARRKQFERLMADLAAEAPQSRAQHHLLIGQRGMGKTMMLARVAAEIRTRPELSASFIPLVFAEEQYAVDRLSKFWLNCLDSLADARELAQETAAVEAIDAAVRQLQATELRAGKDDQPFADEVYTAFVRAAQAGGQRPVLLVDNLQLVFERLSPSQQHSLRELLMRPGSPILVGASPSPPPQSQDYGAAFYDHFKTHYLRPLEVEEMRALLVHLADVAQRDDVRQRVLQHPARLTVLRQLTGGNPRTVLTLFFLYAEDFAPNVFGDLEGLLDRVTPLYKARFEELTPQQQVIASAIANHWDPVTGAKLVEATNLPAGTISSQLDRLEKTGVIERVELFGETRTGYQLAERFFNIWFLMRSASRRQRREVEFLTRFLENFYEPSDRSRLASHLQSERDFSADRQMLLRALSRLLESKEAHDLERHAQLDALRQKEAEARRRLEEVMDFNAMPPCVLAFSELENRLASLVPEGAGVTPEGFSEKVLGDRKMFLSGDREKLTPRAKLSVEVVRKVLDSVEQSQVADAEEYGADAAEWLPRRLSTGQLAAPDDVEDWNVAFRQAPQASVTRLLVDTIPEEVGRRLDSEVVALIYQAVHSAVDAGEDLGKWANALVGGFCDYQESIKLLRKSLSKDDAQPEVWLGLGFCLKRLGAYNESLEAYKKSLSLSESDTTVLAEIGDLYHNQFNRYAEAEAVYKQAIAFDPNWSPLHYKLAVLYKHLHRYNEAEAALREAIKFSEKNNQYWKALGILLRDHTSRFSEAEAAFQQAIALNSQNVSSWLCLGNLYLNFPDRLQDALFAFNKAKEIDPAIPQTAENLLFVHRDLLGEEMSASSWMDCLRGSEEAEHLGLIDLHQAVSAAYSKNWGLARESLEKAFGRSEQGISDNIFEVWFRKTAVFLHLDYGTDLLEFLERRGESARLRPWVEAIRAHLAGDRRALQNIAPEVRAAAEECYDRIDNTLQKLPEKTRRRSLPKPVRKKKSGRRKE